MEGDIDVGGHTLSYKCYGKGSPAVIVEAGGGDKPTLSLTWNAVVLGVLPTTRICIYDRVNVPTSQDVAENLHLSSARSCAGANYPGGALSRRLACARFYASLSAKWRAWSWWILHPHIRRQPS